MRNRIAIFLAWTVLAVLSASLSAAETSCQLTVVTDRPDATYSVGQQAKFLVTLKKDGQPAADAEIACVLDKDGMPPAIQKPVKLDNGKATIEGTLDEPGFLRCRVTFSPAGDRKQTVTAMAGAGFSPLKIPASLPVPDDFDEFWTGQKARLKDVPMKPTLTSVKSPVGGIECFDAQIPCVPPRPVSGYLARPAGAATKSLPAILYVHGAGVRSSSLGAAAGAAKRFGALAMDINAHGIPNGKPGAFYQELSANELKGYTHAGREGREKCYFLGMFLRLTRALEFLTSQPEWDGKTLIVRGSSQGGGQAIAAAGLDPRVTFISAGVPAICDHSGMAIGRASGWPQLVPDSKSKILQVARYFDGMNFAARSKAEAILSVGFIDTTCPPTSVYAAYNNLAGKKEMIAEPLMGHAVSSKFERASDAAIEKHIARKNRSFSSRGAARPDSEEGFVPMFNGKDLSGWEGKKGWWYVEDGAITSQSTPQKPCKECNYLMWRGGKPTDFEMRAEFKLIDGNSGIQFRSKELPNWDTYGYQADMDAAGQWTGALFEHARGGIAMRGQKVVVDRDGRKQVTSIGDTKELFQKIKKDDWNEYRVIARRNEITLQINGVVMSQATDNQEGKAARSGVIALQMHPGPPMKVQFRNLRIEHFSPPEK